MAWTIWHISNQMFHDSILIVLPRVTTWQANFCLLSLPQSRASFVVYGNIALNLNVNHQLLVVQTVSFSIVFLAEQHVVHNLYKNTRSNYMESKSLSEAKKVNEDYIKTGLKSDMYWLCNNTQVAVLDSHYTQSWKRNSPINCS